MGSALLTFAVSLLVDGFEAGPAGGCFVVSAVGPDINLSGPGAGAALLTLAVAAALLVDDTGADPE